MKGRSGTEIKKWSSIINSQNEAGRVRLRIYLCSLALGRKFGESCEAFLERKDLDRFYDWALSIL